VIDIKLFKKKTAKIILMNPIYFIQRKKVMIHLC